MAAVYYFAYDHQHPTGGQKSCYRHVDILNAHGMKAAIVHLTPGYRLHWFDNETPVVNGTEFRRRFDPRKDFVVLPEDLGEKIGQFPGRKVILNQSVYYGFLCFGLKPVPRYPYLRDDVRGVIVKSEHSRRFLNQAYPSLPVHRVFNGIDPAIYTARPPRDKKRIIACPADKNVMDISQVYHILASRAAQKLNRLAGYTWIFIKNMSQQETARVLSQSIFFLFLSTIEGFGRMPLEAMLSGCLVCAYEIEPLTEYLAADNALLSPRGDVLHVIENIEWTADEFAIAPQSLLPRVEAARRSAHRFSPQREQESVVQAWNAILWGNK